MAKPDLVSIAALVGEHTLAEYELEAVADYYEGQFEWHLGVEKWQWLGERHAQLHVVPIPLERRPSEVPGLWHYRLHISLMCDRGVGVLFWLKFGKD